MLSFHFLGAPRLEKNNKLLNLDTRKAVALAAYLALTSRAHQRDELAAFFYPDADTAHARAGLRRTLSTLKTALGDETLEIERDTIGLDTRAVSIDVLEFRALAQQNTFQALTRAVQLYEGDFMDGFTLRDSPAFDEWQFFETESLRKQFGAALEQLLALQTARGSIKPAIESARRWLALDALHEPAHRALMLLYARDGQRGAALRQYQECVRQLDQELGVAPLPETTALYHAIQENRLPVEAHPSPPIDRTPEPPSRPVNYPLVGRRNELALLEREYKNIRAQGVLLILQGEAGIGKTRLAQEFLAQAARNGAAVLEARAYVEQRALAYAPFVQALRTALRSPHNAECVAMLAPHVLVDASRLIPELAPLPPSDAPTTNAAPAFPHDAAGAQARFFDAVIQVILQLTRDEAAHDGGTIPGVLLVDDAQWLDKASLELLAFLVRRLKNTPLCVLLTWRGEEIARDHTLRRLYADALREERAHLIALTRLAETEVQALVNVATERGAPITPELAARLLRESEGQPFFLVEALKLIQQEGVLPADDSLPAGVRELLHSRLAQAGETARQVLSAAAVIGRSFDFDLVETVSGRSDQETIDGLEELAAQGLIVESARAGAPQYDFTHEKLRALVYEETSLARRRLLHRRAADALLRNARTNSDAFAAELAAPIAYHLRAGGQESRAAEFYKRAGDYARSVFANRDAVEHYNAALALGGADPATLHTGIGDAQTLLGDYEAALASYETSAAFGAATANANMARVYLRRGEWERAARHLENALQTKPPFSVQAQLYADLALARHQSRDDGDALKYAERALKLARRAGSKDTAGNHALAQAHNILGILARTRGEWEAARKHLEASRALAEQMNDVGSHAAALNNLALVAHATNEDEQALEYTERALELVTRAGDRHRQAALHNHLADLYHALGREGDSMEQLKRAVAIYAEIGGPVGAWQPEIWKLEEW